MSTAVLTKRHIPTPECAEDCFGCKCLGVSFGASAMPNRRENVVKQNTWEKGMSKDMDSYKRLRGEGIQPHGIQGCANAEQFSNSDFEITSFNRLSSAKVGKQYDEAQAFLTSPEGLQPITPREPVADQ